MSEIVFVSKKKKPFRTLTLLCSRPKCIGDTKKRVLFFTFKKTNARSMYTQRHRKTLFFIKICIDYERKRAKTVHVTVRWTGVGLFH